MQKNLILQGFQELMKNIIIAFKNRSEKHKVPQGILVNSTS